MDNVHRHSVSRDPGPHGHLHLVTVAGGLRCEAVGLAVGGRRCGPHVAARSSGNHEPAATENRRVVLGLLLLLLLGLADFVVGPEERNLLGLLRQHVDHVGHAEVGETMTPRQLQDEVWPDELVAGVEHSGVAFAVSNVDELDLDVGRNLAEEDEVMLLQAASQFDGVVVVVVLDRVSEGLVVLFLDEEVVDGLVDDALVLRLHVEEEGLDERQAVVLLEHLDDAVDVDASRQSSEQVRQQGGVLLDVELDGSVVDLEVGNLDHNLLELLVLPRVLGSLDDGERSIVKLVIVAVAEDQLRPQVGFLAGADHLGHVHSGPEELDVLHETLRVVSGEGNAQLREHSHVGTLEAEALLEKADELIKVAIALVLLDECQKLLGVNNQVQAADLSQAELLLLDAGLVDLLPDLDVVGLPRAVNGSLVVTEVHKGGGELGPVGNAAVEDLGGLEQALLVGLVARLLNVGNVGGVQEVLELRELVQTSVAECQGSVDGGFTQRLASHAQVFDEVLVLARMGGNLDHLGVVLGIIGLDVRVNGVRDSETIQLGLGNLAPDLWKVNLLGVCLGSVDANDVLDKNVDGSRLVIGLLVDLESLLKQTHIYARGGNLVGAVSVQLVDVVHHTRLVCLGGGEQEQVLQVLVVTEGRRLQNNLLEELNKLQRQVVLEEGGDRNGDLGRVGGLGNGRGVDLIHNRAAVDVVLAENKSPKLGIGSLQQVSSLRAVHGVLVGDVDQLQVVLALGVGNIGQVGVALLAVLAHGQGVILVVLFEELFRVVVRVDVDLGKRIVNGLLLVTRPQGGFQEGQQKLEAVSRLDFGDQVVDADLVGVDSTQQLLDDVLVAVDVKQPTDDRRRSRGVDALNIGLDGLELLVLVEVQDQVVDKLLGQLRLLEKVLDLFGVVAVAVSANALHLVKLVRLGRSLDVLEVHVRVLGKVDDAAEVVEETLGRLVLLKQVDETNRDKELRVLGRNVDDGLQVLADVALHHGIEAVEGLLHRQPAKEAGQPLGVEVGAAGHVDDDALDGLGIFIHLEGLLRQAGLLAELGNPRLVKVREHVVAEDSLGHLGRVHQVHLEQASLQASVLWLVFLERIKKESSSLLDHALRLENVTDTLKVDQRALLAIGQGGSKLGALLRVDADDVLQELDVVRLVAGLGRVGQNLVKLPGLGEASDDLLGHIGLEVDGECHVDIIRSHHVTQLLRAIQLAFLEPLLQQVLSVLLEDGLGELDGLVSVQHTLVEKHAEVLQSKGHLARLHGESLELLDRLGCSEEAPGGVGGDLGGLHVVTRVKQLVELLRIKAVRTRQSGSRGQLDGNLRVGGVLEEVGDDGRVVDGDKEHLTLAVDTHKARRVAVGAAGEDGLARDSVHEDEGAGLEVVQVNEAVLGDHEDDAVLLRDLQSHGEVVGRLGREEDVDGLFRESRVRLGMVDLDDVELGAGGGSHGKTEEPGVLGGTLQSQGAESSGMALDGLTNATVLGVQLHGSDDTAALGGDANDDHPLAVLVGAVVDDLATLAQTSDDGFGSRRGEAERNVGIALKDLGRRVLSGVVHVPVVDAGGGDETEGGLANPPPELDVLVHCARLELLLLLEVEDLQRPGLGLEGDDVPIPVHDGTVGLDGPTRDIVAILELDDDDLGLSGLALLFSDADVGVGFERLQRGTSSPVQLTYAGVEANRLRVHPDVGELHQLLKLDGQRRHGAGSVPAMSGGTSRR
ncbi:Uncharacterized protein TCAP_00893 [Tolypocladium capitatum]|uniref:Uncharacterized protein n=1 Tax=Tolypocladium capitatum TaxID=45235 RepID=A0A2K3QNT4_9HYPO|nr:Uncharacterized protein TCAP_00893 [Tolypocladium capitatum]